MEFKHLTQRAQYIRSKYAEYEKNKYGREWTTEELMLGFMKDVGDLATLVQAKEGVRMIDNLDDAIKHEISDCLWSVIVLADRLEVDLEVAFVETMDKLEAKF